MKKMINLITIGKRLLNKSKLDTITQVRGQDWLSVLDAIQRHLLTGGGFV